MKPRLTRLHRSLTVLILISVPFLPTLALAQPANPILKTGGIILNFKHAKIRAVARLISHMTGEDFILNPQIQGNVTIISTQPISPHEVFATFLAVLQVHGYAAVPVAPHLFKIVPALEAHEMPGRILPRRHAGVPGDSLTTDVLHLHFVNAADLVPVLRSLMGPSAQLSAYAPTNSLIVSTRYNNLIRLMRIVRAVDEPIGFNIFHLHYASANTVSRVLTKLVAGQTTGSAPLWIAADERNNSILVRGSPEERLEVKSLIEQLDTPVHHGAAGNTEVIHLRYARATSLAKILERYVRAAQSAQKATKKGARSSHFRAVVVADKSTNSLVITAPLRMMRSIRSVIKKLDIRQAQVLVQAIIAELTTNAAAQLGITWVTDALGTAGTAALTNFSGTGTGVVQVGQAYLGSTSGGIPSGATATSVLSAVPDGLLLGVGRIVQNGLSFAALLNALSSNTAINILSTPSLLALDNQKAKIEVGQKVPFTTGQYAYSGVASAGASASSIVNPFQTIERHEVGIILQIQPQISAGNSVILKIKQKDSTLAPQISGAVDLITNNRNIETTILVNNRQIIVLGGMISDQISTSREQVPFLGSIPLLGNLFRYRSTSKQKENLMVFLRPTILRTKAQASLYTQRDYGLIRSYELAHQRPIPLMAGSKRPTLPALPHPSTRVGPQSSGPGGPDGKP
jgi:general secretion pathway protein D